MYLMGKRTPPTACYNHHFIITDRASKDELDHNADITEVFS